MHSDRRCHLLYNMHMSEELTPYTEPLEKMHDGYIVVPDTGMEYDVLQPTRKAVDVHDAEGGFLYREDPVHTKHNDDNSVIQIRDRWLGDNLRNRAEGAIHQQQVATTMPDGRVEHTVISDLPRFKRVVRYIAETFDLAIINDDVVFSLENSNQ